MSGTATLGGLARKKRGRGGAELQPNSVPQNFKGFSLIEIIVVMAIIAVMAGALVPLASRSIDRTREDETRQRQVRIFEAIMGSERDDSGGFLADIGRLPSRLTELTRRRSLPRYKTSTVGAVGVGWRGPYLSQGLSSSGEPLDAWGTPFNYSVPGQGQILSAGIDQQMGTRDDLIYPPKALTNNELTTTLNLSIKVLDQSASPPVYLDNPGSQSTVICVTRDGRQEALAPYAGPSPFSARLIRGIHAVKVTADPDGAGPEPPVTNTVSLFCRGGNSLQETVVLR